ncbi:MAG: TonB-dependent receptor [Patiriisocius sp.]|uniref:TonB-dependent receptor n=1 Tax=Patiriisocius sp. TaxID=2822396 RepID=UPI003EF2578C
MIKLYLSLFGILLCAPIFGQNAQLTGKIIDASNNIALSGAKIEYNGETIATSNNNGFFTVPCNGSMTLTISYIGYKTNIVKTTNCNETLNVALTPSLNDLDEIQITGVINDNKRQIEKPISEVQLESKELERGVGLYLDDAVNANVPGVTLTRRGVSSGQQFNIRGYGNGVGFRGASNNFDGQGYKVYYNNIPITDAEGVTLLDDIDFGSIGDVDVIKGPAGSLYGFAISGVVNLKTIQPKIGETSISQKVIAGKYGLARFTTQFQTATNETSLLLNYGHQISDGFFVHNASSKDFINAVFNFKPNERQTISTYFGFSNSYDQRAGELTIDQFENQDYSGNERYIKNDAHSEVISFRAGLSHTYSFNNWLSNTTTVFGSGSSSNTSSAGGYSEKNPVNYGTRSSFDLSFDLSSEISLTGSTGLEFQEQQAKVVGYGMVENPSNPEGYNIIGAARSNQFARSKTYTLFTEWVLNLPYDVSITAGLGSSSMFLDLEDRLYDPTSSKARTVSADYKNLVSPHLAVNKIFNDNLSIYASYSKAYNAPVSGNVIISTTGTLNTGLVPEQGNQFEIGSKGVLMNNRLNYQLALFQAIFKDKFTSVAVPLDQNTTAYSYIANGGQLNNKGVEALLKYNAYQSNSGFFVSVDPYINASYSDFKYEDYTYESVDRDGNIFFADYSGNDVAGVAPVVLNAGVDFNTLPGLYGNINYSYRDAVPFTSDGLNVADSFSLLNAKLGFRKNVGKFNIDLYAGADNITGTQYYNMLFINQLDDAYIPAPLDTFFYGGLQVKYNL